jgi:uncharacterized membrane protein
MGPKTFLTLLLLLFLTVLTSASSLRSNSQQALVKSESLPFWPSVASLSNLQADFMDRQINKDKSKETQQPTKLIVVFVVTSIIFAMCCGLIQVLVSLWRTIAAKLTHTKSCENMLEKPKGKQQEKPKERLATYREDRG